MSDFSETIRLSPRNAVAFNSRAYVRLARGDGAA